MNIHPFCAIGRIHRIAGRVSSTRLASNGEAVTAFSTTCADHCSTAFGTHADEKAVGALTLDDGRLVGTFHDDCPRVKSNRQFHPNHLVLSRFPWGKALSAGGRSAPKLLAGITPDGMPGKSGNGTTESRRARFTRAFLLWITFRRQGRIVAYRGVGKRHDGP